MENTEYEFQFFGDPDNLKGDVTIYTIVQGFEDGPEFIVKDGSVIHGMHLTAIEDNFSKLRAFPLIRIFKNKDYEGSAIGGYFTLPTPTVPERNLYSGLEDKIFVDECCACNWDNLEHIFNSIADEYIESYRKQTGSPANHTEESTEKQHTETGIAQKIKEKHHFGKTHKDVPKNALSQEIIWRFLNQIKNAYASGDREKAEISEHDFIEFSKTSGQKILAKELIYHITRAKGPNKNEIEDLLIQKYVASSFENFEEAKRLRAEINKLQNNGGK